MNPPRDPRIIPATEGAVAFLTDRRGTPIGTAFFVSLKGLQRRPPSIYLVTAAHNVVGYEDDTCVRLTRRGGGGVEELETHRWVPHPNEQVDIAVSPVSHIVAHRFEIGFFQVPPVGDDDGFFYGAEWEPNDGDDVY